MFAKMCVPSYVHEICVCLWLMFYEYTRKFELSLVLSNTGIPFSVI